MVIPQGKNALFEKILALTPDKQAEVEDFVDFLRLREDRNTARDMASLSEAVFRSVWDNEDDAVYDQL